MVMLIDSVCLCLTFKCDLVCRHCFVNAGPDRFEEMSFIQIEKTIDNCFENVDRMYFSVGEVTTVMDKLLFALNYAQKKRNTYGFPNKISV